MEAGEDKLLDYLKRQKQVTQTKGRIYVEVKPHNDLSRQKLLPLRDAWTAVRCDCLPERLAHYCLVKWALQNGRELSNVAYLHWNPKHFSFFPLAAPDHLALKPVWSSPSMYFYFFPFNVHLLFCHLVQACLVFLLSLFQWKVYWQMMMEKCLKCLFLFNSALSWISLRRFPLNMNWWPNPWTTWTTTPSGLGLSSKIFNRIPAESRRTSNTRSEWTLRRCSEQTKWRAGGQGQEWSVNVQRNKTFDIDDKMAPEIVGWTQL